jgi:hypothetical protein
METVLLLLVFDKDAAGIPFVAEHLGKDFGEFVRLHELVGLLIP